jgi:NTP-dependent ternary system trypsin peptidase co-occuring protein
MLKRFIEFPLEDGSTIIVEVNEPEGERGTRRAARGTEEEPEKAPQTFEQALSKIRPATEKVIATLRDLIQKPDEVEMEFGFSLSAEAGVIIASASTQANYRVTLRWKGEATETSS